jgi:hypothetical protein
MSSPQGEEIGPPPSLAAYAFSHWEKAAGMPVPEGRMRGLERDCPHPPLRGTLSQRARATYMPSQTPKGG